MVNTRRTFQLQIYEQKGSLVTKKNKTALGLSLDIRSFKCLEGPTNREALKILSDNVGPIGGGPRSGKPITQKRLIFKIQELKKRTRAVVSMDIFCHTSRMVYGVNVELEGHATADNFVCPKELIIQYDDAGNPTTAEDWSNILKLARRCW